MHYTLQRSKVYFAFIRYKGKEVAICARTSSKSWLVYSTGAKLRWISDIPEQGGPEDCLHAYIAWKEGNKKKRTKAKKVKKRRK